MRNGIETLDGCKLDTFYTKALDNKSSIERVVAKFIYTNNANLIYQAIIKVAKDPSRRPFGVVNTNCSPDHMDGYTDYYAFADFLPSRTHKIVMLSPDAILHASYGFSVWGRAIGELTEHQKLQSALGKSTSKLFVCPNTAWSQSEVVMFENLLGKLFPEAEITAFGPGTYFVWAYFPPEGNGDSMKYAIYRFHPNFLFTNIG